MSTNNNVSSNLLAEIKTYNEGKEDLYNKIRSTEINYLINSDNQKIANDVKEKVLKGENNTSTFHNKFREFFNKEYDNNISIGDFFNNKILELQAIIDEKKKELDTTKLNITKSEILQNTTKSYLDIEYNKIVINKIYKHILLIVICILVLLNLLQVLKTYKFIEGYVVMILSIILVLVTIIYIMLVLYSKYPREAHDYNKFKFKLDNKNMDTYYVDNLSQPTVNIDNKVDELAKNSP